MKKTTGFLRGLIAVLLCGSIAPFMLTGCKGSDEKQTDPVPTTPTTTTTVKSTFPDHLLDSDTLALTASCENGGPFDWGCDYWTKTSYSVYYNGTIEITTSYTLSGESKVTKNITYIDLQWMRSVAESFLEKESTYDLDFSGYYDWDYWSFTVYDTDGTSKYIYGGIIDGITELTALANTLAGYEDEESLEDRAYDLFKGTYVCLDDESQSVSLYKANGNYYLVITSADMPDGKIYGINELLLQENGIVFNYVEGDRWKSFVYSYSEDRTQLTDDETSVVYVKQAMEIPDEITSDEDASVEHENPYEPGTPEYIFEQFLNGEIDAEPLEYSPTVERKKSVNFNDLKGDDEEWSFELFSAGEQIDLDNDGENELILNGPYGGMYLDVIDGDLYIFAEGLGNAGTLSYVYYEDAVWIVISDTTHSGRLEYLFYKFDGGDSIADTMNLSAEVYSEDGDALYRFNYELITEEEYNKIHEDIFGT